MSHPKIDGTRACPHSRYWDICQSPECKRKFKKNQTDAANDAIAGLRAAAERLDREEDDKRRMTPPPPHLKPRPSQRAHMTHLLGQLKSLSEVGTR